MPDISKAIPVRSIDGAVLTTGAEYMLLNFTADKGGRYQLAVPTDHIPGLIMTAVAMAGQTARLKGETEAPAMAAESWRLGLDSEGELVMTMRLLGGSEILYRLPKGSLDQLEFALEHFKTEKAPAGETVN